MTDAVGWLNGLDRDAAEATLTRCCGSTAWSQTLAGRLPVADLAALHAAADQAFDALPSEAWLEAFACHPRIGDLESLRMKFAGNREWSAGEQAGAAAADDATLTRLAEGNDAYLARFGWIFLVCATGKSAAEMLELLEARLGNEPEAEFRIACGEQRKITHLRIDKMSAP
ncbi:MAG: 2-oxo-4-hydroxy-4-carboxy-5-ureidoimidazoline decarboxylase [Planctomycetota bacterium]